MEDNLAELDKLVQAIHKREKSMSVYECYATALQIQTLGELSNISIAEIVSLDKPEYSDSIQKLIGAKQALKYQLNKHFDKLAK